MHTLHKLLLLGIACLFMALPIDAEAARSNKKGACMALKNNPNWKTKLEALNVAWIYNWSTSIKPGTPSYVEFVPMQWGKWNVSKKHMDQLANGRHRALLGFNEPDQKNQANMTVEQAIELWPRLMYTGIRLGSPAGVHPDGPWMRQFMKEIDKRGYRVDFIAMHAYPGKDADSFIERVDQIHKLYGRPIWITEFAVGDWEANANKKNRHSVDEVYEFMRKVIPALESRRHVERYAWFSSSPSNHNLGTSSLYKKDGTLNKLGLLYSSY
ncbi:MAG: glycoside hydrolase family protein [Lentimonas sp.]